MSNRDAEGGGWGLSAEVTGKHEDKHPARVGDANGACGCRYVSPNLRAEALTSSTFACG